MGKLFESSSTQKTKTNMGPWGPQQGYITDAFSEAQNLYRNTKDTPFYEGPLYAGMDPMTGQAIDATGAYATGQGGRLANGAGSAAEMLFGAGGDFMGALDAYSAAAGVDPTEANIRAAQAYANNPAIDGMIDAASRDVNRNLFEDTLPGINRDATATGNINSSRAGVVEGIARRGAADRVADISASLRGSAFDRGLEMAEGARRFNTDALGRSAGMYGDALDMGRAFAGAASDLAYTNLGNLQKAGQTRQLDAQGQMDADFMRWQGQDTRAADALARYYGLVGANQWGQTGETTTKTTQRMSPVQAAIGIGSMAAGFGGLGAGGMGGLGGFSVPSFSAPSIGPSLLSGGSLLDLRGGRF